MRWASKKHCVYVFLLFHNSLLIISLDPLRKYEGETITLELPGDMTIFNIDWLAVYDLDTNQNLGSVLIPDGLNVPPSLVKIVVSQHLA